MNDRRPVEADSGQQRFEKRTEACCFRVSGDGSLSYLSSDEELGWKRLAPAAVVDGRYCRGELAGLEARADGAEFVLSVGYGDSGLVETMAVRLLADPPALTVERVFDNRGQACLQVERVEMIPAGPDAGVLFAGAGAGSLRCVHVSNVRESFRRVGRATGPFVCPLPWWPRLIGDSEGYPFPALAICDADMRTFLLEASGQQDVFTQMWLIRGRYEPPLAGSIFSEYAAIARDGRSQPVTLRPGQQRRLASLFYQIKTDCDVQDLYDDYLAEVNRRYDLRVKRSPLRENAMYCTWNYGFFADISEEVIRRQCRRLSERLPGVRYFLIDDGYQRSENTPSYDFGKWYPDPDANVDPVRFPNGMAAVAEMIRSHGLQPAIWWSPAMGRSNRLVAEHPDWLCLDETGRSWSMDSGPARKAALDFSVKEVREFVEFALETIFVKWGYVGMKLDFCTYPFDSKDIRFREGEGVRWWYWFLDKIAELIPADGFFQLCGGAPYGNCFLGRYCDSYRIGGDIGKGLWRQHVAVSGAPLPLLGVPGRANMLMDVDSAGIRLDMTEAENLSRLNWCFITQGVMGVGGDLTELSDQQIGWLRRITDSCDRGHKVRCPDRRAFTGDPRPEVLYVDYPPDSRAARSGIRKHVGLFNWGDEPRTVGYALSALGIAGDDRVRDFWTGEPVGLAGGQLAAALGGRASKLVEVRRD